MAGRGTGPALAVELDTTSHHGAPPCISCLVSSTLAHAAHDATGYTLTLAWHALVPCYLIRCTIQKMRWRIFYCIFHLGRLVLNHRRWVTVERPQAVADAV